MGAKFVALREGETIHALLDQVIEHRDPVMLRVVVGGAVGDLDEQAAGLRDQ
jgi:hypothetical protein